MPHSGYWTPPFPSFGALVQHRARERADFPALTLLAEGELEAGVWTGAELDRRARIVAGRLQASARPGDRALLVYPTSLDFAAAFMGCLYAGVIAVPVPEPLMPRHLLRLAGIVHDAQIEHVLTTSAMLPAIRQGLTVSGATPIWIATDRLEPFWADAFRQVEVEPSSLAFLQYTSGSTGAPRGVMVSHSNLMANSQMIQEWFQVDEQTVLVSWLPLFHDMGLIVKLLQTLYAGARCVLMSPFDFLRRPARWLQAVSRYRGTLSGAPDFAYSLAAYKMTPEDCEGLDLSSWEIAFNGAEPVRLQTIERFSDRFAPYGFRPQALVPGYGLAEATVMVSGRPVLGGPRYFRLDSGAFQANRVKPANHDAGDVIAVSCGRTDILDQQIRIIDPDTRVECGPDRVGEIWVSGAHVAQGYWQKPEDTAEVFEATIAGSGAGPYMRTGDLGFLIDGELVIAGRIKDLIIVDGSNHYPQDIEQTTEEAHNAVRKGCVAAFSIDRDGQERVVVVAELPPAGRIAGGVAPAMVQAAIRRVISQQHGLRVEDVVFIRERTIPKTSSGKIQRHACREAYLAGELVLWQAPQP